MQAVRLAQLRPALWPLGYNIDEINNNGIRSAARGRVDQCPARAAAAVSAADPTFRPEYSAHLSSELSFSQLQDEKQQINNKTLANQCL